MRIPAISICELFSNPCTYGDPHMHTAIPVWEITHMGKQDLISHMEIFPVCKRLVTEISPYAYGDRINPRMRIQGLRVMRSPYAYGDLHMHTGIDFDPCMHTGIA